MLSSLSLLAVLAATAAAKTIVINAGQSGFSFSPDSSTADVGDVLEFHFFGSIHTAVQSDFSSPCAMSSSGFNSGPINNKADGSGSVFQVTVKDTNPIWFFCGTPGHCQSGMAGVINPPSSGDSLSTYKSNAAGTSSQSGGTVQGGVVAPVPSAGASSSSSAPSSSAPAAPPSSSKVVASSATATTSSTEVASSFTKTSVTATSSTPPSSESAASSEATSSAQGSTLTASTAPTLSSAVGSSSSAVSTSLSSPTPITTSGGAKSVGNLGMVSLLVIGMSVIVGFL